MFDVCLGGLGTVGQHPTGSHGCIHENENMCQVIASRDCSDPRARSDPNGEYEPKPWDARFISFIFRVIKFSFSKM